MTLPVTVRLSSRAEPHRTELVTWDVSEGAIVEMGSFVGGVQVDSGGPAAIPFRLPREALGHTLDLLITSGLASDPRLDIAQVWCATAILARVEGIRRWWDREIDEQVLAEERAWALWMTGALLGEGWAIDLLPASGGDEEGALSPEPDAGWRPNSQDWRRLTALLGIDDSRERPGDFNFDGQTAFVYRFMPVRSVDRRVLPRILPLADETLEMLGSAEEIGSGISLVVVPAMPRLGERSALTELSVQVGERAGTAGGATEAVLDWSGALWVGRAVGESVMDCVIKPGDGQSAPPIDSGAARDLARWSSEDRVGPWASQLATEKAATDARVDVIVRPTGLNELEIRTVDLAEPPDLNESDWGSVEVPVGSGDPVGRLYKTPFGRGAVVRVPDAIAAYGRLRSIIGVAEIAAMRTTVRALGSGADRADVDDPWWQPVHAAFEAGSGEVSTGA